MEKIRLTKNELKKQKDDLKRFVRYLPTLELKKKQLLVEIRRIQGEIDSLRSESDRARNEVLEWSGVFAEDFDLRPLIRVSGRSTSTGNIAGIDIPVFEEMRFEEAEIDFLNTPLWIDRALEVCRDEVERRARIEIGERQQEIVREELRVTVQRIKLFEEVKIPEARENIRVIQIFLGDQQTAEVVRGKIAKSKLERKKRAEAA